MKKEMNLTKAEIMDHLNGFMDQVKSLNESVELDKFKSIHRDLEGFLSKLITDDHDGFFESLKVYNQTGTWCNKSFLKRIIQHFQEKWSLQPKVFVY